MSFQVGDRATFQTTFTNVDTDAPFDPSGVIAFVRSPSGGEASSEYLVDSALVKTAVGSYELEVVLVEAGAYSCKFQGYDSSGVPLVSTPTQTVNVTKSGFRTPY